MPGRLKLVPQRLFDVINGDIEEAPHCIVVAAQIPCVTAIVVAINCADAPDGLLVKICDLVAVFDLELDLQAQQRHGPHSCMLWRRLP